MKKYIIGIMLTITAVFAFIALLPLQAYFFGDAETQKLSNGDSASIEVELPQAYREKISSLQLSLEVTDQDGSSAKAGILDGIEQLSFTPSEAITSKTDIYEQRYHEDTGILTIYIAGEEPLFSEQDKLEIGTITASLNGTEDIYVRLAEDSFKIVKGISLENVTEEMEAKVLIQATGNVNPPVESTNPTDSVNPTDSPKDPANSMNDTSQLRSALDIAATLQESDYTAESFAVLKKAVEDGMAVLNNPNATQAEVDQAAEAIYNAIGMLVRNHETSVDNNTLTKAEQPGKKLKGGALTGDSNAIWVYVAALFISSAALVAVTIRKKHQM